MRCSLVLALAAIAATSQADAPKRAPPAPPPAKRFERDMAVRFHMHESFDLLRAIERLLIRGKLDDARSFARAISEAPDEPMLGAWALYITQVRDRAGALAGATTIDDACRREAKLAAACAGCHVDTGVMPEFRDHPPAPPDLATVEARMARHRWAADRLWEAIVGGTDEPWRAGLDVLAARPLEWKAIAPDRATSARDLQRIADQARRVKQSKVDDRAATYGELLVTCAACHTMEAAR